MLRQIYHRRIVSSGFTLLEMLVVLAIIAIVTAITLSSLPSFRDNISIDLVANQIATIVREGQIYGQTQKAGEAVYFYGLRFNSSLPKIFWLNSYAVNDSDDLSAGFDFNKSIQSYDIPGDIVIEEISVYSADPSAPPLACIDVVFQKRYPEPNFFSCSDSSQLNGSFLAIKLTSDRAKRSKYVKIWANGQISADNNL